MLKLEWADIEGFKRFDNQIKSLGEDMPKVITRALNRTGDMARTQVYRALTKQTGLKRKVIQKAVKTKRASYRDLVYEMSATGGNISLKYFSPRETRKGVTANPFGKRVLFAGAFMHGGRFPNRVHTPLLGGHVWKRYGAGRDVEMQDSDVFIPKEMLSGATASAFQRTVRDVLPRRLEHEIGRLIK